MRLTDYVNSPAEIKKRYFDTVTLQVGLRYFGGKSQIGKFLLNRIFEMQAYRYVSEKYKPAEYFIDAFTGGGKMALSIPTGWFEHIVINDLNYGVYSYYICCKHKPLELVEMIKMLGSIMCYEVFMLCARERSTPNKHLPDEILKIVGSNKVTEVTEGDHTVNINGDMILSGAMTYWVTQSSWLGETDPESVSYSLDVNKNEKEEIQKRIRTAQKRIMQINEKMNRQDYIIENMDYIDLIKKYRNEEECVIWYLDPPYHANTLNKSVMDTSKNKDEAKPAPYEDSFPPEMTTAMTAILNKMNWFIKSDYDPYYFFNDMDDCYHDFDSIEDISQGFVREYLGSFNKGTGDEGIEVIWSRYDGSPESVDYMLGKNTEDRKACEEFWELKRESREKWIKKKTSFEKGIYRLFATSPLLGLSEEQEIELYNKLLNARESQ